MQPSNKIAGTKFDNRDYGMRVVKTITTAVVERLNSPYAKSTYETALVYEWAVEWLREELSPHKQDAIAGTGSLLNGLYLSEATRRPHLRAEMNEALVHALETGQDVVMSGGRA